MATDTAADTISTTAQTIESRPPKDRIAVHLHPPGIAEPPAYLDQVQSNRSYVSCASTQAGNAGNAPNWRHVAVKYPSTPQRRIGCHQPLRDLRRQSSLARPAP